MERKLWKHLYKAVMTVDYDPGPRRREPVIRDRAIAAVLLWAALRDRPVSWACVPRHWADHRRMPRPLPSQPTVSRRLRSRAVRRLLNAVMRHFHGGDHGTWIRRLDGKPLPVGLCSKDPDARWGRSCGGWFRGYKLHAIWGDAATPDAWEVRPAHAAEPVVMRLLVRRTAGTGYLLGDSSFDSNPLHRVAARRGFCVVAPPKKRQRDLGHRRHHPTRLHALEMLGRPFGRALYGSRGAIERSFGHLSSFGGGLGPLPAWVRRRWRVRLWVQAKLLINAARIKEHRQSRFAA